MMLRLIFCEVYQDDAGNPQKRFITHDIPIPSSSGITFDTPIIGGEWIDKHYNEAEHDNGE